MKKITHILGLAGLTLLIFSCNSANLGEKAETTDAAEVQEIEGDKMVYALNDDGSIIEWTGSKPTGTHNGTIAVERGELFVKDGKIAGGEFVIDMKSIVNFDLEDEEWNTKLVNHLHSEDFFHTDIYPEATFVITNVEEFSGTVNEGAPVPTHTITGNLTMKEITKSIKFNAMVDLNENSISAESVPFVIDRTLWDVKFKSKKIFNNLQDDFIHDDIGLKIIIDSKLRS